MLVEVSLSPVRPDQLDPIGEASRYPCVDDGVQRSRSLTATEDQNDRAVTTEASMRRVPALSGEAVSEEAHGDCL
jgi:hypothetical protein